MNNSDQCMIGASAVSNGWSTWFTRSYAGYTIVSVGLNFQGASTATQSKANRIG
jgi:hypothetical protein